MKTKAIHMGSRDKRTRFCYPPANCQCLNNEKSQILFVPLLTTKQKKKIVDDTNLLLSPSHQKDRTRKSFSVSPKKT